MFYVDYTCDQKPWAAGCQIVLLKDDISAWWLVVELCAMSKVVACMSLGQ